MSASPWQQSSCLAQQLIQAPYTFEFHQAVRILQSWNSIDTVSDAHFYDRKENFQFSCPIHDASSPSDISKITLTQSSTPNYQLQINFFGISNVHGTLPPPFSDLISERSAHGDDTLQNFIDIFNHRLLTLLHKIRQKYWPGLAINDPIHHPYATVLFSLCGESQSPSSFKAETTPSLISYANLFWQEQRSFAGLQRLIQSYFGYKIECQAWHGQWCRLHETQETRLNRQNQILGVNTTLGTHIWQQDRGFIMKIYSKNYKEFQNLLPNGSDFQTLQNVTRTYCGIQHTVRLHLILQPEDTPAVGLGQTSRLGWTTWLKTQNHQHQKPSLIGLWLID